MNIVQHISRLIDIRLFIAGHTRQYSEPEKKAAHSHERATFAGAFQRVRESAARQFGVGCRLQQTFAQGSKCDLRFGSLERRARETQEDVALPVEVRQSARCIRECCGTLVESCALALDLKVPPSLSPEPIAQILGVPSHEFEIRIAARDKRTHQQGAYGTLSFLFLLLRQYVFEAAGLHDFR